MSFKSLKSKTRCLVAILIVLQIVLMPIAVIAEDTAAENISTSTSTQSTNPTPSTSSTSASDPTPTSDPTPSSDPASTSDPAPESDPLSSTNTAPTSNQEPKSDPEPAPKSEPVADPEPDEEPKADPEPDEEPKADPEPDVEPEPLKEKVEPVATGDNASSTGGSGPGNSYVAELTEGSVVVGTGIDHEFTLMFTEAGSQTFGSARFDFSGSLFSDYTLIGDTGGGVGLTDSQGRDWYAEMFTNYITLTASGSDAYLTQGESVSVLFKANSPATAGIYDLGTTEAWTDNSGVDNGDNKNNPVSYYNEEVSVWVAGQERIVTSSGNIQDSINAADAYDLISVEAGTYEENIIINKALMLSGAGQENTIIYPAFSGPDPGGAGSLPVGSSNVILVQAHNVTICDLTVDGDNPNLTSGIVIGGADIDARNGIITDHRIGPFHNLEIYNTTVRNIYFRGIQISSANTFNIHHNIVDNVGMNAIMNWAGAGIIAYNTVSNVPNNGITSNHSQGTEYLNNYVYNVGIGIHSDNNVVSGDLIQGNVVENAGYGILTFNPNVGITVANNTIINSDVGLTALGGQTGDGGMTTFTGNIVDGQNRAGSTGAYVTPDLWGHGYSHVVRAFFQNNIFKNLDYGFSFKNNEETSTITSTIHYNDISNINLTMIDNSHDINNDTIDASGNWWGTTNPAAVNVTGKVDFTPMLASGIDTDPGAPGFQPDLSELIVHTLGEQVGVAGRIQEGINMVDIGGTVNVQWGYYNENIVIDKADLYLIADLGAILDGTGIGGNGILIKAPNTHIDGFEIRNYAIGIRTFGGPSSFGDLDILNCAIHNNSQNGILIVHDLFDTVNIEKSQIINNTQSGIGISNGAVIGHLIIDQADISFNKHHGLYIANDGTTLNALTVSDTYMFENNMSAVTIDSGSSVSNAAFYNSALVQSDINFVIRGNNTIVNGLSMLNSSLSGSPTNHGFQLLNGTVNNLDFQNVAMNNNRYQGFFVSNNATLNNAIITGGTIQNNDWGLLTRDSTINNLIISGVQITDNIFGSGLSVASGTVNGLTVENCNFQNNAWEHLDIGVGWIGPITASNVNIDGNTFGIGPWTAVYIASNANYGDNDIQFRNNSFTTGDWGVFNANTTIVDARNNWWGDASGPSGGVTDPISGAIADGTGDEVSENVRFSDWLLNPPDYVPPTFPGFGGGIYVPGFTVPVFPMPPIPATPSADAPVTPPVATPAAVVPFIVIVPETLFTVEFVTEGTAEDLAEARETYEAALLILEANRDDMTEEEIALVELDQALALAAILALELALETDEADLNAAVEAYLVAMELLEEHGGRLSEEQLEAVTELLEAVAAVLIALGADLAV